jgi:aspartate aminotransferase-like enzyme
MTELESKLEDIFAEGLEARFARHRTLAQMTRDWAAKHGFMLFPEPSSESVTLTCVSNGARPGGRVVDVPQLQKRVKDQELGTKEQAASAGLHVCADRVELGLVLRASATDNSVSDNLNPTKGLS